MNANDARELANKFHDRCNIDIILAGIDEEIEKAAKEGNSHVRLAGVKNVPEVKRILKKRGFNVAAYRTNSLEDKNNGIDFSGEMLVEW